MASILKNKLPVPKGGVPIRNTSDQEPSFAPLNSYGGRQRMQAPTSDAGQIVPNTAILKEGVVRDGAPPTTSTL